MSNKTNSSNRRKGATAGLVFCFIAAIALVGTYTVRHYQNQVEDKLAQAQEEAQAAIDKMEEPSEAANNLIFQEDDTKEDDLKTEEENTETKEPEPLEISETAGDTAQVNFSQEDKLLWPVSGDVILNYSMDKTVYFATLDQYKYNPALIISGAVNDQVMSAGKGIVKSIDVSAETGTSLTVDMGNGYEAVYGQLKEVPVKVGDYVEAKSILGYLSEPTKYYSIEGCNLYFAMKKDGQAINPMEFLEQ